MRRKFWRRREPTGHAPQCPGAAVSQYPSFPGDPAVGVDDHPDRRWSRHCTRRQLGIISRDRLGTDDYGIHQRTQPVQVLPVLRT